VKNLAGRLDRAEPVAQQRAVRIAEEQGKILAEVIHRSASGLLAEVLAVLDAEGNTAAAAIRREWPGWVARIVPAEIEAVTGVGSPSAVAR